MQHSIIRYLKRDEIDDNKWNDCIKKSINGTIYSLTNYLDIMTSKRWNALVSGDYEVVFPLPSKKKYRIEYIYNPAFMQQLGIVFKSKTDVSFEEKMVEHIPRSIRYIDINLNTANTISKNIIRRKNHILNLSSSYEQLKNDFSRLAKRNIAKAINNNIQITENISPEQIMHLHRLRFKDEIGVHKKDYENFLLLMNWMCKEKMGFCFGALNNKNGITASSFYALYKNRLYFILNGNSAESLDTGATHLLKDYVINKFSGQNLWMDFEGSDNENFARFYKQFGAIEEPYARLTINRLPPILKRMKK